MAALSGAAIGSAVGGLLGALIGMGIPEYEAKRYEGKLQDGNILFRFIQRTAPKPTGQKRCSSEAMLMIILLLQKVALNEVQTPFLILASPNRARLAEIITALRSDR